MKRVEPSAALENHSKRSRTVKFVTLGCKVNQYDTQVMREQFLDSGFKEVDNHFPADIYLINTCTVTASADSKSRYFIRDAYRQNPKARIIVTGCYAELDSAKILESPGVTDVIKNRDKDRILELLNENNKINEDNDTDETGISSFSGHTRAFLKIQDGCNNFCSYCKVPLVRGRSRSRDISSIVSEAQQLVKNGFKEIVLCGICLGAYGRDLQSRKNLVDVVRALEGIEGLARIRLSSIEAGDVTDELIEKMSESKKLCWHLHIPMQSGDAEILKKMNRHYTGFDYINLIKKIKTKMPQIAITTDVLVGFPGETEENFQNTVELIKKILPLKVHIFPFSARGDTAAANLRGRVHSFKIKERMSLLYKISKEGAFNFCHQFLNKEMDVLFESKVLEEANFWEGHTNNYIKVRLESELNLKNQLLPLRLKKIIKDKGYLLGEFS